MGVHSRPRRSLLVYSALATDRWDEAMRSGADLALFDLEDGTAQSRKDEARTAILPFFARPVPAGSPGRLLRINSPRSPEGLRDLLSVLEHEHAPDGLVIPKVNHPQEVAWVGDVLGSRHPSLELIALIETQAGLAYAGEIAQSHPRLSALFLGAVDLSAELGSDMSWDALYDARAVLIRASSAAGIDCIDGPWLDVSDSDGLRDEARRLCSMGFTGKASYDSSQLDAIHTAFTPSDSEIAFAQRVADAVSASRTGGAVVDGQSVNKANAKSAERVLKRARRLRRIP